MEQAGAALMIRDSDLTRSLFPAVAQLMADEERRAAMREASLRLARADAARVIATAVAELAV